MIPATWEISAALTGAWRLLFLDKQGLQYFDDSVAGFWKSFFAAVLVLPVHLVLVWIHLTELDIGAGPVRVVLVESIAYVIGWVAFPLLMFYLCETIGKSGNYLRYIVAYNWFQVLLAGIVLVVRVILVSDLLPLQGAQLLAFADLFVRLSYYWYLALIGLSAGGWVASLVVLTDLVIGLVILGTADWMLL